MSDILKKYSWMGPIIDQMDRDIKKIFMKNFRLREKNFFPKSECKADAKNLINCMLCPNMCRFDCGSLQASRKESMSPAYKSRIGYYLTIGKIDPSDEKNKEFIDLMYKCSNEENCKVWCPFEFSVVSLLETVRDDLNDKGLMPEYCKSQLEKLKKTNTIEDYNIFKTYKEKGIDNIETTGNEEIFYYIGCEAMKFPEVVNANIEILKKVGIRFSTNLEKRTCCGAPAFNIRDLNLAKDLAEKNEALIESTGAKFIISDCPGCVDTLTRRYQKNGININAKIVHITEYFKQLVDEGKVHFKKPISDEYKTVTIHDPCLLARNLKNASAIRDVLKNVQGLELIEPIYNKELTHCCGWSGTLHLADKETSIREATNRVNELMETGAKVIVSACPLCELGLSNGIQENDKDNVKIIDISELLAKVI